MEQTQTTKQLPSDFTIMPMNSVKQKNEAEVIALNIMLVLERTGNVFRELTYDEYVAERQKDGNFSNIEKQFFDDVIGFCKSADTARLFSPKWQ